MVTWKAFAPFCLHCSLCVGSVVTVLCSTHDAATLASLMTISLIPVTYAVDRELLRYLECHGESLSQDTGVVFCNTWLNMGGAT